MGGALKCRVKVKRVLCDHVLGEFTLYGVITKQISHYYCPEGERQGGSTLKVKQLFV